MREDDIFGIGLARAENGDKYRDLNPDADDYDMALECTYRFSPCPWMTLQPGVQFINNPGMDPALDDALAFSLRAYIVF
jgi:carbohydrate-selective porin OprB